MSSLLPSKAQAFLELTSRKPHPPAGLLESTSNLIEILPEILSGGQISKSMRELSSVASNSLSKITCSSWKREISYLYIKSRSWGLLQHSWKQLQKTSRSVFQQCQNKVSLFQQFYLLVHFNHMYLWVMLLFFLLIITH